MCPPGHFDRPGTAIQFLRDGHPARLLKQFRWLRRRLERVFDPPDLIPHRELAATGNIRQRVPKQTTQTQSACGAYEIHPLQPYFALLSLKWGWQPEYQLKVSLNQHLGDGTFGEYVYIFLVHGHAMPSSDVGMPITKTEGICALRSDAACFRR